MATARNGLSLGLSDISISGPDSDSEADAESDSDAVVVVAQSRQRRGNGGKEKEEEEAVLPSAQHFHGCYLLTSLKKGYKHHTYIGKFSFILAISP